MDELQHRLEKTEASIEDISKCISSILEMNKEFNLCIKKNMHQLSSLQKSVKIMNYSIEDQKMKQDKSIKLIYTWIGFSVALILTSILMTYAGNSFLKAVEFLSSWGTCIFLIAGGIYSAKITYGIDKKTGYIVSASWALISTCYIGYVLLDFGSLHPLAGAIGFNIGASAQTFALVALVALLVKILEKKALKKNG